MAEFQEVMREWVRSRKAINENKLSCCPLEMFNDDYIANIEKEVMTWAAEHSEPVYRTCLELAVQPGFKIEEGKRYTDGEELFILFIASMSTLFPADIAKKFGVGINT